MSREEKNQNAGLGAGPRRPGPGGGFGQLPWGCLSKKQRILKEPLKD